MSTHATSRQHPPRATDLRCTRCGYGVAGPRRPALCPMCGANRWVAARPGSLR